MEIKRCFSTKVQIELKKKIYTKVKIKEVVYWITLITTIFLLFYFIDMTFDVIYGKQPGKLGILIFPIFIFMWIAFLKLDDFDLLSEVEEYRDKFFIILKVFYDEYNTCNDFSKLNYIRKKYIDEIIYYIYVYLIKIKKYDKPLYGLENKKDKEIVEMLKVIFGKNIVELLKCNQEGQQLIKDMLEFYKILLNKEFKHENENDVKKLHQIKDLIDKVSIYKINEIDSKKQERLIIDKWNRLKRNKLAQFIIFSFIFIIFVILGVWAVYLYKGKNHDWGEVILALYTIIPSSISMLILIGNMIFKKEMKE